MLSGAIMPSVLSPAGIQSSSIYQLWSLMLWASTVVFVLTVGFVAAAFARGVRRVRSEDPSSSDKRLARAVAVAVAATIVILVGLLVASVWTGRSVASLHASSAVTIEVTGQ